MCKKLAELERAMGVFAQSFEPALISAAQAEGVMERAARIEHMACTVKALAAARMAETELWGIGGDRTPAHMLARRTGQTVSGAAPTAGGGQEARRAPQDRRRGAPGQAVTAAGRGHHRGGLGRSERRGRPVGH